MVKNADTIYKHLAYLSAGSVKNKYGDNDDDDDNNDNDDDDDDDDKRQSSFRFHFCRFPTTVPHSCIDTDTDIETATDTDRGVHIFL